MGQVCLVTVVFIIMVASLAVILVALLTDNWYRVHTADNINPELKKSYNFHYGLWRLCYDDMPTAISSDSSYKKDGGSCVYIHDWLIQKNEDELSLGSRVRIHLSRAVLGCSIAAAAAVLASLISLTCGVWPGRCARVQRPFLYFVTSMFLFLGTICGFVSGICFIAVRDLDNETFRTVAVRPPAVPEYTSQEYYWSFMLHWIGSGLAFVDSFILLCMMRNVYQSVNEANKFSF